MPNSSEHLDFNAFIPSLHAIDKQQIIHTLSWKIGRTTHADMTWISDRFSESEKQESSGIGDGVAILHLKSTPLAAPFILVAKLDRAVDFDAIDGLPVDIVCAVLSPQMDGPLHLQRLSRITRLFRDVETLEKLRCATSEEEMRFILAPDLTTRILAA